MGKNMNRILFGIFFLSTLVSADWYNASWLYRKQITVDHTQVAGDLSNFPVLINDGADSDFLAHAKADGSDFVITESDGTTKLKREIEEYDSTDGSLVLWFKAPSLLAAIDTTYYVYYGNAAASEVNDVDTWDANYVGVWHIAEDGTGTRYDATSNDNDGTPMNYDGDEAVIGQIDGADTLAGVNDYISMGDVLNFEWDDLLSFEIWIKTNTSSHCRAVLSKQNRSSPWNGWQLEINRKQVGDISFYHATTFFPSNVLHIYTRDVDIEDNSWHHISVTKSNNLASGMKIYKDGVNQSIYLDLNTLISGGTSTTINTQIGARNGRYDPLMGIIDEVRISDIVRDSSWIATCYNNQYAPATFLTLGSEESPAPAGGAKWRGYYDGKNLQIWGIK